MNSPLMGIATVLFGLGIICVVVLLYIFRYVKRTKVISPTMPIITTAVVFVGATSFVGSAVLSLIAAAS